MRNLRWFVIGGGLLVAVSVFFVGLRAYENDRTFRGSAIGEPAPRAADFELMRTDGYLYRLSEQTGKVVLIFTGYTNCPDECPATLGEFKQIAEQLGQEAANVEFVFITVDPNRDTPEVLADYLGNFSADFIGLTGGTDQLQKVWGVYGGGIPEQPDASGGYEVSHSTRIWVLDKEGLLRVTFPLGLPVSDMTHDIQILLAE